jgi:hypothetical protein
MQRFLRATAVITLVLLSPRVEAYWGNTHQAINEKIAGSKTFDFVRVGVPIRSLADYFKAVLFIEDALDHEAKGVPFCFGLPVRFSTVPDSPSLPAIRCIGLFCQAFPWPQFEKPEPFSAQPTYWASRSGAYPIDRLAWGPDSFLGLGEYWRVDEACWSQYQEPLLKWAFGYSQSALALLFQPVEAEIVPDKDAPLSKVRVRVRNLNKPDGGDAVTWHLKRIRITPLFPARYSFQDFLTDADKTVEPPNVAGHDVGPGQTFESDAFELDLASRYGLLASSHTGLSRHPEAAGDRVLPNSEVLTARCSSCGKEIADEARSDINDSDDDGRYGDREEPPVDAGRDGRPPSRPERSEQGAAGCPPRGGYLCPERICASSLATFCRREAAASSADSAVTSFLLSPAISALSASRSAPPKSTDS